jgi:tetratricopeptide (TPR) repeat protein
MLSSELAHQPPTSNSHLPKFRLGIGIWSWGVGAAGKRRDSDQPASHQAATIPLGMSRPSAFIFFSVVVMFCPVPVAGQVKDDFVQALVRFADAAAGRSGDEGPAVVAAIDAMAEGLAQWDAAIGRMESGLKVDIGGAPPPIAARMRTALGAAYLEHGRLDEALAQFEAAAALDPQFPGVHVLKGLAEDAANRPAQAAAAYRAAWQRQPANIAAGYRALLADRGTDAVLVADVASALSSAVERGAPPGAPGAAAFITASLMDEASVASPLFVPALYSDAVTLLSNARYGDAIDAFRKAAATDPLVTDSALQSEEAKAGAAALRRQDARAAIGALTTAAERNPNSSEVHRLLGLALSLDRRDRDSIEHLKAAIQRNSRDERSRLALADVLFESGDPAGTRQVLVELTQTISGSAQGHWKLARLDQTFDDEASALKSFQASSELPLLAGRSHLYRAIARIEHNQLDLDSAVAAYRRRVELTPNDAAAHVDLGEVYRAQDRLDEALAEFSIASLLDATSVRALATAAQIHAAAGRDDSAVTLLRRAVALDPSHLEARYALSRALLRLGRSGEARRELEVFEQLQQKAMQDERRRFQDNQIRIDETLKAGERREPGR